MRRTLGMLAALALGLSILGACRGSEPSRSAVAAAKCSLPVGQKLGLDDNDYLRTVDVQVEDLGDGRFRVSGLAVTTGVAGEVDKSASYVCEVAPDSADKLRGFRVTKLEVKDALVGFAD